MSTIDHTKTETLPPLVAGERLDRATFHARYEAMPPETRAELIGGVVCMPSPLSGDHGSEDNRIAGWLFHYTRFTRGVKAMGHVSAFLDDLGEPQPDAALIIKPEFGGQTHVDSGYLSGPPELVVEVSRSSRRTDLGPKLRDYERSGVLEYLVVALDPDEIFWHRRRDGRFVRMEADPEGCFRSEVFPGLWLDLRALFEDDPNGIIATLDRGLASPEHAAFVSRLAKPETASQ
jgi:Uma2 family endonuclease